MGDDTENLSLARFVGLAEPKRGAWRMVAHKGQRSTFSPDLDPNRLRYVRALQAVKDAVGSMDAPLVGALMPSPIPSPEAAFCALFPEVMAWLAENGIDYESSVKPFVPEMLRAS